MSYAQKLMQMLRPLGVYTFRDGSFSMGQLEALGAQMDEVDGLLQTMLQENLVMTAQNEGLEKQEALFAFRAPVHTTQQRRNALSGFFQIGGDSFTPAALQGCLKACGANCLLEEADEVNHVIVSFPGVMGRPADFALVKRIIEMILPCQLGILYRFCWCTWGQTEQYGLTWADLGEKTWYGWMTYRE